MSSERVRVALRKKTRIDQQPASDGFIGATAGGSLVLGVRAIRAILVHKDRLVEVVRPDQLVQLDLQERRDQLARLARLARLA